jgi:fructose-1,6-bisphosphatase II
VSVLAHDFVTVTEEAARAAAQTMGYGDAEHCDRVATEAMRATLDRLDIAGQLVTDPLAGAQLCAKGAPGALSVLAASERGGLLRVGDIYIEKLIVGRTARGEVHLDAPVPENLRSIARAYGREVSDLTVVVLDRERHEQLVSDIRGAGARIRLIPDGDLSAAVAVAVRGTGVHAVMGTGRGPDGVFAAAALRCLGGEIQARFRPRDEAEQKLLVELGIHAFDRVYSTEDLAPGDSIVLSATGVTDGEILRGVRFFGGGSRTSTLVVSQPGSIVRFVETIHQEEPGCPVHFYRGRE